MQASQVLSTVWITYWEVDKFHRSMGFYQGIYAMFGCSQAIFTFAMGSALGMLCYYASNTLFRSALRRVFFAPMSFFDTQPLGRIMGVFGKDIDTVDTTLAEALRMQTMTLAMLLGSVIIITVYFHYFIAIIFGVGCGYWYFAQFYRTSAREVKRLDSMLRSLLYAHFSESLSGLATIRAYGETKRFIHDNAYYMDLEDRAYVLTYSNQRWLAIRLDLLGALLVFAVAIMCAAGGGGLQPSEIALCLTYMTQITQMFGMVTRQSAEVENASEWG
jgi:ABC-type multidrug transport system fused ATPase/permease subunit